MKTCLIPLVIVIVTICGTAAGQTNGDLDKARAKTHYEAGLEAVRDGELSVALEQFRLAYVVRPHFSVLYNIGQALTAVGRPVEAIEAFEGYLELGQAQIAEARRREVDQLVARNRSRVASLRIVGAMVETKLWIDGRPVSTDALQETLPLAEGPHLVLYSHGGDEPRTTAFVAVAGQTSVVDLPPPAPQSLGWIHIECELPDVEVRLAGEMRGLTPTVAVIPVRAGPARVTLSRLGYVTQEMVVVVARHLGTRISCALRQEPQLSPPLSGHVRLETAAGVRAWVDGKALSATPIPIGRHSLRLEREGFQPQSSTIIVEAGKTLLIQRQLKPTPATVERARAKGQRRQVGWWLAGASALSIGASGATYAWNSHQFDEWKAQRAREPHSVDPGRAAALQRVDDAALGALLLGAGLGIGAAWVLLPAD